MLLGGNAYVRDFRTMNFSSNVNDRYGQVNLATGEIETNAATNDRSVIAQTSWGLGAQLTVKAELPGRPHQLSLGASADFGDTRFQQDSQPANFSADRGAVASGAFSPQTDVSATNRYLGVYASDTLSLSDAWTLTLAGRYNHARISIVDHGDDMGSDTSGINGTHTFARFDPAIGINFSPSTTFTAYASYNEGMRAPTPIELTCADASAPCKLPNLFLADPPLK